ncbi:MAG: hypothetical protein M1823_006212 [Watsoniomyces obsoletus]|nr:MAG: hypothetical protein M1823_006212 [Watsoniomyces obsoletus]
MQLIRLFSLLVLSTVALGVPQGLPSSADERVKHLGTIQKNPWPGRVVTGVTTVLGLTTVGWLLNRRFRSEAPPEQASSGTSPSSVHASGEAPSRTVVDSTTPEHPIYKALAGNEERIQCIVKWCDLVVDEVLRHFTIPWYIWNPAVDFCIGDKTLHLDKGRGVSIPMRKIPTTELEPAAVDERRIPDDPHDHQRLEFSMAAVRGWTSDAVGRVGHLNINPADIQKVMIGAVANRAPVKFNVRKTAPLVLKA